MTGEVIPRNELIHDPCQIERDQMQERNRRILDEVVGHWDCLRQVRDSLEHEEFDKQGIRNQGDGA